MVQCMVDSYCMKQNFAFIFKLLLLVGDGVALILAFTVAYVLRVSLDPRPIAVPVPAVTYITLIIVLLPLWIGIFYLLGLYTKRVFSRRPKEAGRLLLGAVSGILLLVTFDFFTTEAIFPAKLVPVYAALLAFVFLWVFRSLMRNLRLYLYARKYGVVRLLIVGSSETTYYLSKYLNENPQSGYDIVGLVAKKASVYEPLRNIVYRSVATALKTTNAHAIIQTDSLDATEVYNQAIENHLDYQFIPSHSALFTSRHSVELLGAFPIINVHTTPLIGYGRVVKRAMDILLGTILLLLFSPLILLVSLLLMIFDQGDPIYRQKRLTRFNKTIHIYKFRTYYHAYHRMSPEAGFTKLGKPELIKKYRESGDVLENDPRVSKVGRFLRRTSLDEVLQLINVIKGDISLVGPRSLEPFELDNYEYKSLILSVKSGLTGLAQISGRRDISFEERRKLDMYYVQNWSIGLDLQIILRTIFSVITGRGAQ